MHLENEVFLRQKQITEQEAREQVRSNLEEVQRLERLSSNLLALHQYGEVALVLSAVSVKRIVDDALQQVQATADAKGMKLITEVAAGKVSGHHDSLVQVIDIVMDNALKYGLKGGEVRIQGEKRFNQYILSVKDKGPGIADKDLPRIFDRLYRGDKARSAQVGGYGLGLALAREIAIANDAAIAARNNPDGGACFELTLRLVP
jgi:signal transduction histidine kinase